MNFIPNVFNTNTFTAFEFTIRNVVIQICALKCIILTFCNLTMKVTRELLIPRLDTLIYFC